MPVVYSRYRARVLALPELSSRRLAVRLTPDSERHVRGGHPWVFDGSMLSVSPSENEASAGDLAVIFNKKRDFLAIGLFDPASPIRIKILHQGKPCQIDADFWSSTISRAIEIRQPLKNDSQTTGYRLINGESDGMPGLVADIYGSHLVVKLYSAAWFPHLESVLSVLVKQVGTEEVVIRLSRTVERGPTFGLRDGLVARFEDGKLIEADKTEVVAAFLENGFALKADLVNGQKTGHFLDQRENRARVGALSDGKTVLDVFCCTGGFALNAAGCGAKSVHAVDSAPKAIAAVRANFDRNRGNEQVAACVLTTAMGDAFDEMEKLIEAKRRFDVIVIDPPSFAQRQQDIGNALRSYKRLTELGVNLLEPGGVMVQASCSSRVTSDDFADVVVGTANKAGFRLNAFALIGHGLDHPAEFPEAEYLKVVFARPSRVHQQRTGAKRGRRS